MKEKARRPSGAQCTTLDRMVSEALKEADTAVVGRDIDPVTVSAHIAGGTAQVVGHRGRKDDGVCRLGWLSVRIDGNRRVCYATGWQRTGCSTACYSV